ncbi:MAG: bifunctional phosphoribosylaminoimidazolecarboxamide formyltransferase/IMP cyclohydrolase [Bacteroidetes bacterium]|nr:bifunctional phosphoribosylaminoimidazolecarboxamide formyltransferase/IMP cyclohydrolase [Bacteroidota bacterium]
MKKIERALISVSDKRGIIEFAAGLNQRGVELLSTGGTYKLLKENGIPVTAVEEYTGFPEMLDGRVKTLHPKIHGGILARKNRQEDLEIIAEHGIKVIDLVIVNLYPFEATVSKPGVHLEDAIENIDIGGPSMLRAAAKNYLFTSPVVDSADYSEILSLMDQNGNDLPETYRYNLMVKVFSHTAHYDTAIANYFRTHHQPQAGFAPFLQISLPLSESLRYGENAHQAAAVYGKFADSFTKLHGKELSYNNLVDVQASVELIEEFSEPTLAIIKHTNPCGVASASSLSEAWDLAFETDKLAPFGGIIAVNKPLDMATAEKINDIFTEIIIAPDFEPGVLEFLQKKRDRRLLRQIKKVAGTYPFQIKSIAGGYLVQTPDNHQTTLEHLKVVTQRQPTEQELKNLLFAWRVVKHVKSNAIVFGGNQRTLGVGAGQMSRVDSSKVAVWKAQEAGLSLAGSVVASDAFFPFSDGVIEAAKAGAKAVIQPGGSVRDQEVIDAADANGLTMVFTGIRHFRH